MKKLNQYENDRQTLGGILIMIDDCSAVLFMPFFVSTFDVVSDSVVGRPKFRYHVSRVCKDSSSRLRFFLMRQSFSTSMRLHLLVFDL